jgi:hypothetical protein
MHHSIPETFGLGHVAAPDCQWPLHRTAHAATNTANGGCGRAGGWLLRVTSSSYVARRVTFIVLLLVPPPLCYLMVHVSTCQQHGLATMTATAHAHQEGSMAGSPVWHNKTQQGLMSTLVGCNTVAVTMCS